MCLIATILVYQNPARAKPNIHQTNRERTKEKELLYSMATLQRSTFSFRRKGSSGVVWDDRFSKGEFRERESHEGNAEYRELRPCQSSKPSTMMNFGIKEHGGGSNINVADPSNSVNFQRSFSAVAPKKQSHFGGKFSKILPAGLRRSETMKKSN